MARRADLHKILVSALGNNNVYFQPPANVKLSYPAIVYHLGGIQTLKADNTNYQKNRKYTITLIHKDPDNDVVEKLLDLKYSSMVSKPYISDGLYHYVFEVFY